MNSAALDAGSLHSFEKSYDVDREDQALNARGEFLRAFPARRLRRLTLREYVIGHRQPTFCDFVEAKTRAWAAIQGSTAFKFGIYFGKVRSEPGVRRYRFTKRYGLTERSAFRRIRAALSELVDLGRARTIDFAAIDANPLSQLFKAKILSLYYPDRFLNVCSKEHLLTLARAFRMPRGLPISHYQHLLIEIKQSNAIARGWSNPKFMMYLYQRFVPKKKRELQREERKRNERRRRRRVVPRKIDYDAAHAQRTARGKAAEKFALRWERRRLIGSGLRHLVPKIQNLCEESGHGYDFRSFNPNASRRYIEVKSVARVSSVGRYRFFLSENERIVSKRGGIRAGYYFYLVHFNDAGKPVDLQVVRSDDLFRRATLTAATYVVKLTL